MPGREDGTGQSPPRRVGLAGRALPGVRAGREVPGTGLCELDTRGECDGHRESRPDAEPGSVQLAERSAWA